jgi:three-Cys-motif partner protein
MTSNRFGGAWTGQKLDILREYLHFYSQALKAAPRPERPFNLVYIDAFAGTGRCKVRTGRGSSEVIPGSASVALDNARPFKHYHFIEPKQRHLKELRALVASHPNAARCTVHPGTAHERLPEVLARYDWTSHRAVLFLDPFGLQCDWAMLERIRQTKAIDVFFLLNVSGLFRNAALNADRIESEKAAALTRVFGNDEWRQAWYAQKQQVLFDEAQETRQVTWQGIVRYCTGRLRELFPEVLEPALLMSGSNAPLFALYLAVSNPSQEARKLAAKAGRQILNKLR